MSPSPPTPETPSPTAGPAARIGCLGGALGSFWVGLLILAAVSAAAFLFLPRLLQGPLDLGGEAVGKRLEALELQPLVNTQTPVTLDDVEGKVVVLNFWGTWCPPCLVELPHLAELYRGFKGRDDFRLLAVSCGRGAKEDIDILRAETEGLFEDRGLDMPAYADVDFVTRQAFAQLDELRGYPTTVVLDRQTRVRRVWVGFDPGMPEQIESLVEEILGE